MGKPQERSNNEELNDFVESWPSGSAAVFGISKVLPAETWKPPYRQPRRGCLDEVDELECDTVRNCSQD